MAARFFIEETSTGRELYQNHPPHSLVFHTHTGTIDEEMVGLSHRPLTTDLSSGQAANYGQEKLPTPNKAAKTDGCLTDLFNFLFFAGTSLSVSLTVCVHDTHDCT